MSLAAPDISVAVYLATRLQSQVAGVSGGPRGSWEESGVADRDLSEGGSLREWNGSCGPVPVKCQYSRLPRLRHASECKGSPEAQTWLLGTGVEIRILTQSLGGGALQAGRGSQMRGS